MGIELVHFLLYRVGRNVAAGMTGGLGYFLDEDNTFPTKVLIQIIAIFIDSFLCGLKSIPC